MSLISILICTRNRAEHLRETLTSLAGVILPDNHSAELIVVDNGSTDETRNVVQSASHPLLERIHYVLQPIPGKANAINLGLAEAKGTFIISSDDDVRFPSRWLVDTYQRLWNGSADAIQGGLVIAPQLKRSWMTEDFQTMMASTEFLDGSQAPNLVGANMGFHRRLLDKVPYFDRELGPGAIGQSEDTLFTMQIRQAGFRVEAAYGLVLEHHFDISRLRRENIIKRYQAEGRSRAYIDFHWNHIDASATLNIDLLRSYYTLAKWRLQNRRDLQTEGLPAVEALLVSYNAYLKQMKTEMTRGRNYEQYGLIRKSDEAVPRR